MRTDSRGRLRFTHNGQRFEINEKGILRAYAREIAGPGTERAKPANVTTLDNHGMSKLYRAVNQYRKNVAWARCAFFEDRTA